MRIRTPIAASLLLLLLPLAYLFLTPKSLPIPDKLLHAVSLFLLTTLFYWSIETTRRRILTLTLLSITIPFGILSEFVQHLLSPTRPFDPIDILANLLGSFSALALMAWYHKRMLDRRRIAKLSATTSSVNYHPVATTDHDDDHNADAGGDDYHVGGVDVVHLEEGRGRRSLSNDPVRLNTHTGHNGSSVGTK